MNTALILQHIAAAQRAAGAVMLSATDALAQEKSGHRDVVTQYDQRVQAMLMEHLAAVVPGSSFYCEELAENCPLDGERVFIIDPIDGTMNFLKGLHHSCISIAYCERGELLAGAVYNPYADELFTAEKGKGAFLNGKPIHVAETTLADSLVHFGTSPYYDSVTDDTFAVARKVYAASLDVRRKGSAALDLCDVAAGRVGLYFEMSLSLWDYAAGALLVREAGGVVTRMDGSALPFDGGKPSILAGNRDCVEAFLKL